MSVPSRWLKTSARWLILIPLVNYTEADLLAEGRPDRPYLGKRQHSLVALFNNQPAGILIAYERPSENRPGYALPSVYINILAVDPALQGRGIGSHLLQNFLAREKNSGFVCLDGPKQLASVQTNSAPFNEPVARQDLSQPETPPMTIVRMSF